MYGGEQHFNNVTITCGADESSAIYSFKTR